MRVRTRRARHAGGVGGHTSSARLHAPVRARKNIEPRALTSSRLDTRSTSTNEARSAAAARKVSEGTGAAADMRIACAVRFRHAKRASAQTANCIQSAQRADKRQSTRTACARCTRCAELPPELHARTIAQCTPEVSDSQPHADKCESGARNRARSTRMQGEREVNGQADRRRRARADSEECTRAQTHAHLPCTFFRQSRKVQRPWCV